MLLLRPAPLYLAPDLAKPADRYAKLGQEADVYEVRGEWWCVYRSKNLEFWMPAQKF